MAKAKQAPTDEFLTDEERAERADEELEKDRARVAKMSDDQVLQRSDFGRFGPGIVGQAIWERARDILRSTGGGIFGPAVTDPEFAARNKVRKQLPDDASDAENKITNLAHAEQRGGANETPSADAWDAVTLSGAKHLAQQHQISYTPRARRADLIADLKAAGVIPPVPVQTPDEDDDIDRE